MSEATRSPPGDRVRIEVAVSALIAGLWLFAGLRVTAGHADPPTARRWFGVAGAVVVAELAYLRLSLDACRPESGATRRRSLGLANVVTLCRGGLFASVAGFLAVPSAGPLVWGPSVCYGAGVALDRLDGAVARTIGRTTALGERLDLAFDTLGFVVAPLVAVAWGRLPVWYLSLSAARYVFKAGVAWRRRRGRPVCDLPESRLRRPLAALQMCFLTVALAPVVPAGSLRAVAAVVLAPSLTVFARDYLAVSGRLRSTR
ncbi:CDP-alcohol phosphatidyltransferase family protein [Halorussus marinus]|uniref:CDP-alcohol phosphatidyltransferase family protein n=1 Tax=Halorussus marinus TaxID=2505976 RepID=UPI0014307266|nr:CDP-alcohol phosphatidyltransferase family protein [Halorussus marinus]